MKKFDLVQSLKKTIRNVENKLAIKHENNTLQKLLVNRSLDIDFNILIPDLRHLHSNKLEQVKTISIRILRIFDHLCRERGIEYFLGYGTLLGAIRHKGFIPWDDDIDIFISRKNYDNLLKVIDQLPIELSFFCLGKNFYKIMDLSSLISRDGKRGIAIDLFLMDENESSYYVYNVYTKRNLIINKSSTFPLLMHPFESYRFPIPSNYHDILTRIYGDYMTPPPEKDRVSRHFDLNQIQIARYGIVLVDKDHIV